MQKMLPMLAPRLLALQPPWRRLHLRRRPRANLPKPKLRANANDAGCHADGQALEQENTTQHDETHQDRMYAQPAMTAMNKLAAQLAHGKLRTPHPTLGGTAVATEGGRFFGIAFSAAAPMGRRPKGGPTQPRGGYFGRLGPQGAAFCCGCCCSCWYCCSCTCCCDCCCCCCCCCTADCCGCCCC